MSGRLTGLAVAAVTTSLLLAAPAVVVAAPGSGGGQGTGGQSGGVLGAGVTYASGGGTGGGGGDGCSWQMIDGDAAVPNMGVASWPRVVDGVTYHIWERRCPGSVYSQLFEIAETGPADLLPDLIRQLREQDLPSPEPVFQALDPAHGWAYVTVPVDFRSGGDSWRTVSVTARYGPIWATVTATPSTLSFDPGDPAGSEATCDGEAPVAGYVASAPGACSYTYTNSSATSAYDGYHFLTSMSIEWTVSWTSSTGAGGPLDGWSTTGTAPLAVAEVQGVVTCTGSRASQGGCSMVRTLDRRETASTNGHVDVPVASVASPTKRRPTWVLFGALLVGLSAVIGAWVFTATSERMSVVTAARDIEPGEVLAATDLRIVEIGQSSELRAVLSDQQELVLGQAARGPIPAGTVLNTDLFASPDQAIPAGSSVVGASLESGAAPIADLRPGDRVDLLAVERVQGAPISDSPARAPTAIVLTSGTVWSLEPPASASASSTVWVAIVVPTETQGDVAQAAADGLLRLSLVGADE